jgi:putative SOS response-associated peptidase YedK
MVDRYTLTLEKAALSKQFEVELEGDFIPRYNAAPTQSLPVITQSVPTKFQFFKWGLMSEWSNNKRMSPKLFNLPIDSAIEKPTHRKSIINRRCIIPANGFYLWKPIAKRKLTPYYFTFADNQTLALAGIWEERDEFDEHSACSFIMITTTASPLVESYQDNMPLILDESAQKTWISSTDSLEEITGLLNNYANPELSVHPVLPIISNIAYDSEDMILPSVPSDQHGNYTLFN